MRGPLVVVGSMTLLAGCGIVSGLDSLGVCDACADAADVTVGIDAAGDVVAIDVSNPPDVSTTDASEGGTTTEPHCFNEKCSTGEVCCINSSGQSMCAKQSCPQNYVALSCSRPADCPNSYCCLKIPGQTIVSASCSTQCGNILCDPLNGSDAGCPSQDDCLPVSPQPLPNGFGVCF